MLETPREVPGEGEEPDRGMIRKGSARSALNGPPDRARKVRVPFKMRDGGPCDMIPVPPRTVKHGYSYGSRLAPGKRPYAKLGQE